MMEVITLNNINGTCMNRYKAVLLHVIWLHGSQMTLSFGVNPNQDFVRGFGE